MQEVSDQAHRRFQLLPQYMRRATRDEYLEDLITSGDVVTLTAKSGGIRYLLSEYAK